MSDRDAESGPPNEAAPRAALTVTPPARIALPSRFVLRAWTIADVGAFAEALAASEAHLRPWTPWVIDGRVAGQTLEARVAQHARAFAEGTEWVYGLFAPDEATVAGGCGLYPRVGPKAIEIGYWLAAGQTGRGLATEATAALTRVAFADPAIDEVQIRCEPRNVASARVPERLGYHLVTAPDATAPVDALRTLSVWRLSRAEHDAGPA